MRVLLHDIMFPNKYAKWRLVEIKSFIEEFDTDILIMNKITKTNIKYDFDFDELRISHNLDDYDVLIFNPNFNAIFV